jgi:hypothetical protein
VTVIKIRKKTLMMRSLGISSSWKKSGDDAGVNFHQSKRDRLNRAGHTAARRAADRAVNRRTSMRNTVTKTKLHRRGAGRVRSYRHRGRHLPEISCGKWSCGVTRPESRN